MPGWTKLALLVLLACAGARAASHVHGDRSRSKVASSTQRMKPVCVGRLLADVPAEAVVSLAHEMIGGFEIETEEETEADFRARMSKREAAINGRSRGYLIEIPAVPGFCTSRAVFAEPLPPHVNENVTMYLALPSHPDLAFALSSIANAHPGPGLLARAADVDAVPEADQVSPTTRLRSDTRSINGFPGEETAERVREPNSTTGYSLNWEARGVQGDVLQPYVSCEMQAGVSLQPDVPPTNASLGQDAVLALWDTIVSTIRAHHGEQPAPQTQPPLVRR
jgi:hypothetical protein